MTTPNQAREAILGRFVTNFVPVAFSDVAEPGRAALYSFDNEEKDAGINADPVAQSWCRLAIRESASAQETLGPVGGRRYRRDGAVVLSLYCPASRGTKKSDSMVKTFRDVFEGVSFSGLAFTDCQVQEIGAEGASWRVDAICSFWFEEVK
jgi:hypothetical protein